MMDILIESLSYDCKFNIWKWDILKNHFYDTGYFGSLSAPLNTFEDFLDKIYNAQRHDVAKHLRYQIQNNEALEVTMCLLSDSGSQSQVLMRGKVLSENGNKNAYGIIMEIKNNNSMSDNKNLFLSEKDFSLWIHKLTQPLMVAKTYASGCLLRLNENKIDNEQLNFIIQKLIHQISLAGNMIHEIKDL